MQRLFGHPDYLLRIVTADLAAYQPLEVRAIGRSTLYCALAPADAPLAAGEAS